LRRQIDAHPVRPAGKQRYMRGAAAERAEHENQMKKLILKAKPGRFGIGLAQSGGRLPNQGI